MRVQGAFLASILLLAALAGCVSPAADVQPASASPPMDVAAITAKLSPVLGDLKILHETLDVKTSQGLVNVDLYKPDVPADVKLPVILVASPYNTPYDPTGAPFFEGGKRPDKDNWISLPLYEWIKAQIIPRGYAFAQMDVLGTRNSGGCQGIMDEKERKATAETVDWLGSQEWSNGKVGMIGKSYLGLSQLGAAVENPKHLAAIVPISPPTQDYAYHYYNGVPYLVNHLTNPLYTSAYSAPPPSGDPATYLPRYVERFPCYPETLAWSAASMGDYDAHWKARDYRPLIPQMRSDVAVFFIAGHQDWNVKPDHLLGVYNEIPGPKMALLGQWAHDYPNKNNWDVKTFGDREDWYFTLHRWFDHWLKGIDTGLMQEAAACPVQTQASDKVWRCLDAWPPAATGLALHPTAQGALAPEPGSGSAAYADDNVRQEMAPVPGQIVYKLKVEEVTRIAGAPEVNVTLSTTAAFDTYVTAALALEKDGGLAEFTWGFLSLRHRDGLESGKEITPGAAYTVTFRMYPVDTVLQPGDVLALVLRGSSDAPNLGTAPSPTPGVQTVDLAKTTLTLPTMPTEPTFEPMKKEDLPEAYAPNTRA